MATCSLVRYCGKPGPSACVRCGRSLCPRHWTGTYCGNSHHPHREAGEADAPHAPKRIVALKERAQRVLCDGCGRNLPTDLITTHRCEDERDRRRGPRDVNRVAAVRRLAAEGKTLSESALELGVKPSSLHRMASNLGVTFVDGRAKRHARAEAG